MYRYLVLTALVACGAPPPAAGPPAETQAATTATPAGTETRAAAPLSTPEPKASGEDAGAVGAPRAKPSNNDPSQRIGARHVLIQWMGADKAPTSVVRSREQALAIAQEVLKRAKAKEDFARLAVEYSDEPNAGPRGGSLGRFGHGQMVAAFEAAVFKLEVGEISDIIETPFGYHIIQRTE